MTTVSMLISSDGQKYSYIQVVILSPLSVKQKLDESSANCLLYIADNSHNLLSALKMFVSFL